MKAIFTLFLSVLLFAVCHATINDTLRINPQALNALSAGTYAINDTTSISIWVYNDGSNVVNDNLAFGFKIGAMATQLTDTSQVNNIQYTNPPVTIQAHDSILLTTIIFHFGAPDFIAGSSIVVIWPVALHNNTVVQDSATRQITVIDTATALLNAPAEVNLKVFISGQQLWVVGDDKNLVKEVRIYDELGKLITRQPVFQPAGIPMDRYAGGTYFAEVILSNNSHRVFKIFK